MPDTDLHFNIEKTLSDDATFHRFSVLRNTIHELIYMPRMPESVVRYLEGVRSVLIDVLNLCCGNASLHGPFPEKYRNKVGQGYFAVVLSIADEFNKIVTNLLYDAGLYADGIDKKPEDIILNLDIDEFICGTGRLRKFSETINETITNEFSHQLKTPKHINKVGKAVFEAYVNPLNK